ncbi:dual specificity phosphatase domain protein [Yasminevirus sp. GU-2018]|uniref:Dual specificity phosphatase domain protein n=1 Tax=Yasminevirus sp. GU-2018 TaxID=2420051 RepID=A0A5K0U9D1_9VIRU|nr:dual specificity phosphatase domain protein [Yasminevirus sp. GU-2018]
MSRNTYVKIDAHKYDQKNQFRENSTGDYSKIEPYDMWLGDAQTAIDVDFLESKNIGVIIDVGSKNIYDFKNDSHPYESIYNSKLTELTPKLRKSKFVYKRIDIADDPTESLDCHFVDVIETIETAFSEGRSVLIHCQAGVSRSATLVVAYVMYKRDMDYLEALSYVRRFRRSIRPNVGFVKQLKQFNPPQPPKIK